MKDYINGCYTKYGTRSLYPLEIKHRESLGHGFEYAVGYIPNKEDGISIDIFKDGEILCWEHGIQAINTDFKKMKDYTMLREIALNRLREMYPQIFH